MQKRAIRILAKAPCLSHTTQIFKKENILPLDYLIKLKICLLFYDVKHHYDHPLQNCFQINQNYSSRRSNNIQVNYSRTEFRKRSIFVNGVVIANEILHNYLNIQNRDLLKSKIKKYLISQL